MIELDADVAVLGAGFGGSLTALILQRIGLNVVLIDRGVHPRFAVGESSTPIADLVLTDLTRQYDLPRLSPLTRYGTWQKSYPEIVCGLKRGFSYFKHNRGQRFVPRDDHANELLVAASNDDLVSDTHWLRSDVDQFFADEARAAGIAFLDQTEVSASQQSNGWLLTGERHSEAVRICAQFAIDATGEAGFVTNALGISNGPAGLRTNSRAIYAHFEQVKPWHELLHAAGGQVQDHPYPCDNAALHHILDDGWMWLLRFKNGVTSAGLVLDARRHPLDPSVPAADEWHAFLHEHPTIAEQFADARIVQPAGGLRRTQRLQRRSPKIVGSNWALLPNTAGFVDPLHSTGIAHTMCGIERLTRIFSRCWKRPELFDELKQYERTVHAELDMIDELVSGCYLAFGQFPLMIAVSMLYFAAATTYEHRRIHHTGGFSEAFLCADDPHLRHVVHTLSQRLQEQLAKRPVVANEVQDYEREVAAAIEPFNVAGLCNPDANNMYRYTALPET